MVLRIMEELSGSDTSSMELVQIHLPQWLGKGKQVTSHGMCPKLWEGVWKCESVSETVLEAWKQFESGI